MDTSKFRKLTDSDLDRMNLPSVLWKSQLSKIPPEAREVITRYIEDIDSWMAKGVGFLLLGGPKIGKTSASAVLAKAAKARGKSAFFIRVGELRDSIKKDTPFSDDMSVHDRCKTVDFLVLDDLSNEDATLPYLNAHGLTDLVLLRGERFKTTVITSASKELKEKYPRFFTSASNYLVPITLKDAERADPLKNKIKRDLVG